MIITHAIYAQHTAIETVHSSTMRNGRLLSLTAPSASATPEETTDQFTGTDSAQLQLVGTMLSQASRTTDVRFALIDSLRARIKAGTYRVSAADLADSVMGSMYR